MPPNPEAVCPSGCVAQQSLSYIELRLGPTHVVEEDGFIYKLDRSVTVKSLDVWVGTQSGHVFESDSRLQIVLPNGDFIEYMLQFDKHMDIEGSKQRYFDNLDMHLPEGTMLYLYHTHQGVIQCPTEGCGYDTTWRLYLMQ